MITIDVEQGLEDLAKTTLDLATYMKENDMISPVALLLAISDGSSVFQQQGIPEGDLACIVVPVADYMTYSLESFKMLTAILSSGNPEAQALQEGMVEYLSQNPEMPVDSVMDIILKQVGLTIRDLLPLYLKTTIGAMSCYGMGLILDVRVKSIETSPEELEKRLAENADTLETDPEASDALMIQIHSAKGTEAKIWPYTKSEDGSYVFDPDGEYNVDHHAEVEGRYTEFFQKTDPN